MRVRARACVCAGRGGGGGGCYVGCEGQLLAADTPNRTRRQQANRAADVPNTRTAARTLAHTHTDTHLVVVLWLGHEGIGVVRGAGGAVLTQTQTRHGRCCCVLRCCCLLGARCACCAVCCCGCCSCCLLLLHTWCVAHTHAHTHTQAYLVRRCVTTALSRHSACGAPPGMVPGWHAPRASDDTHRHDHTPTHPHTHTRTRTRARTHTHTHTHNTHTHTTHTHARARPTFAFFFLSTGARSASVLGPSSASTALSSAARTAAPSAHLSLRVMGASSRLVLKW
jgi:hypothetical protein